MLSAADRQLLQVTGGGKTCVIDLAHERYRITPDEGILDLLKQHNKTITAIRGECSDPVPLSEWQTSASLRWQLGLQLSDGKLMTSLHDTSRFKLLRWPPPDISRASPSIMTLCALLGRSAGATIDEIVSASNIPAHQAIAFINGAYLARAVSVRAFQTEAKDRNQATPAHSRSLFAKIRDRLKRKPL